jgi:SAM-dependent methyltransferase
MLINTESRVSSAPASAWVTRFVPLIRRGCWVLDLGAGSGRHTRLLLETSFAACAVDRDTSALLPLAAYDCEVRQPSRGNERFGHPHNPDFLLQPGELLDAFAMLTVIAFEQSEVSVPRPAVIQRIAAVAGPLGRLPEPVGLNNGVPTE